MSVKAEVVFRGRDETAAALRNIVRNTETAQRNITAKLRSAFAFLGTGVALTGFTRELTNMIRQGDDLAKFAAKTKLTAEAASEFAHVARMSDTDIGAFSLGIRTMQTRISEAASGSKSAVQLFKSLGIELEHLQSLSTDQRFELIADQISKLGAEEDQTRARTEAFGRAGEALAPAMAEGAAGIRKLREETQLLFNEEDLRRIQEADTAFKNLSASWDRLTGHVAISVGPGLGRVADRVRGFLGGGTEKEKLQDELRIAESAVQSFGDTINDSPQGLAALERYSQALLALAEHNVAAAAKAAPGFAVGEMPPGFSWIGEVGKAAKLSKQELEELARFNDQAITMRNDAARLSGSIAPDISENDAALRRYFAGVMDDNLPQTPRVIELGEAFSEAETKADSLMDTIRDEAARESFEALNELVGGFGDGADDAAENILSAFRKILANKITSQLIELLMGLGGGGTQGGFLGALGQGFTWLFGGTMGRAHGGSVFAGNPTWVGEKGKPELFVPNQSGTIIPAHRVGAGGGAITLAPNYNIQIDARSDAAVIEARIVQITTEGNRRMMEQLQLQRSLGR